MSTVMDVALQQTSGLLEAAEGQYAQAQPQGGHLAIQLGAEAAHAAPAPPPGADEAPGGSSVFECELEVILLQLALGHSLPSSQSPLAALPREVMQHHVARHVRSLYMEDLGGRGLLTPVQELAAPPEVVPPLLAISRAPPSLVRRVSVRRQTHVMPGVKRRQLTFADFAAGGSQQDNFGGEEDMHTRALLAALARFRSESPKDWPQPVSCDPDTN